MANKFEGGAAICPYFVNATRSSITCEGNFDGVMCVHRFCSTELRDEHMKACCETGDYEWLCPHAVWLSACYMKGQKDIISAIKMVEQITEE